MSKKNIIVVALMICLGFILIPYDKLHTYRSRRDFAASPEPIGKKMVKKSEKKPIFVIQKHDASHLHYDFRIEMDGVLKSWAIPKGPSTDPKEKRLAMPTEDHPMEYANFEGVIPEGHYGAGPVLIWDRGTFDNIKEKNGKPISLEQSYKNGQIEIFLHGKKLEGGYALIRMHGPGKERWLCVKMDDEYADARRNPVSSQPESVVSGKTIEEIARGK
jgi:DNA ligase D-like protein (predicted 3'-phosphoesterase)